MRIADAFKGDLKRLPLFFSQKKLDKERARFYYGDVMRWKAFLHNPISCAGA